MHCALHLRVRAYKYAGKTRNWKTAIKWELFACEFRRKLVGSGERQVDEFHCSRWEPIRGCFKTGVTRNLRSTLFPNVDNSVNTRHLNNENIHSFRFHGISNAPGPFVNVKCRTM
jgi:hypothetical protein